MPSSSPRDPLTGLPYRAALVAALRAALDRPAEQRGNVVVMLIDLESFTEINHLLGRPRGDVILVSMADRLRRCVRENDIVARVGGDEFGLVCQGSRLRSARASLRARIERAFSRPINFKDGELVVGAAIGAVTAEEGETDPEAVLSRAHSAVRAETDAQPWVANAGSR